ncbi:hypothetical protein PVAND_006285 [Polypedilum vanderplanki]|uniref:Insulin-like domain-containing protein n=1 Tax=Polypedilum vanderplanki TaxID=319348 RepID=A0A9J6C2Q9_POLVA|nr:hypothetical protein PVAND_006285 [Polypedilum vanderplanki]
MKSLALISLTILGISALSNQNALPDTDISLPENVRVCGYKLNAAIKFFCRPHVKNRILQGVRSGYEKRTPNFLDQLWNVHYLNDDDDYGQNDKAPNALMHYIFDKRNDDDDISITKQCCRRSCSLETFIQFCPP